MKKYVFESLKFFCAAILCVILSAFATPSHAALLDGYTELQYIESTGTQYIDTLLPVKSNTLPEVIYQQTSCSGTGSVFGQVGGSITNLLAYRTHSSDNVFWFARLNPVACDTSKHTVVFNSDGKLYKDGTAIGTRGEFGSGSSLPMLLFAISSDNNTIKYGTVKIFSFKVKEGDTLVRNMVPAKNSSGKIGMYDTVNDVFYENKGTGSFIAGPETCNGTIVNYTSATGTGVQNGTPTPTNPIEPTFYKQGNMILRKVGDYADSYDATTGKITRRVGVKVLDGTEGWQVSESHNFSYLANILYGKVNGASSGNMSTHFPTYTSWTTFDEADVHYAILTQSSNACSIKNTDFENGDVAGFKSWLAAQYAAGTPVTVWYPLATAVEEDWTETSYCETPIKIATTKYNETKFSPLNTALANAISVVDTVVSNTITQAASIATLQAQKQTRPNDIADDSEKCPAGKKCLLVEDASGVPHWYEIVENAWDLPVGYTQLQYIESTGGQYIDTGVKLTSSHDVEIKFNVVNPLHMFLFGGRISNSSEYYGVYLDASTHIQTGFGSVKPTFSVADYSGQDTVYKCDRGTLSWNSNILQVLTEVFGGTYNAYLFGLDERESLHQYTYVGKMYYAKIWDDGTLVRDFVPAKNSSGVVGMYDTVNGVFYENKGTGSFIAGDPVSE